MVTKQVFVQLTLAGLLSVTAAALARGQQSIDELPSDLRKAVVEVTYAVRPAGGEAVYPVYIDPWIATEEAKLTAPDGMGQDHFGMAIAVSGDTAVIGATGDSHPGAVSAGSAYVFVRSGTSWSPQQKLVASDAATNDRFGVSVAISGETIVVGADLADIEDGGNAGSAYVFVRNGTTWSEQAKLFASDAADHDNFGNSVAVSGDTAVVGARWDDAETGDMGAAYVFVRSGTTWSEQQKLTANDAAADDWFGHSVAVSGDTTVVGSSQDDHAGGVNAGSAYSFVRSGTIWSQQQKLIAGDAAAHDYFGSSIALSGDTAAIGAPEDGSAGIAGSGAAYVFVRSGASWSEQQKLTASDASDNDEFGWSISVSSDTAVVGARWDDHAGGLNAGSAYVFARSGTAWSEVAKLIGSDTEVDDEFGQCVAISGDTAAVGVPFDDQAGGPNFGSAFAFRLLEGRASYCTAGTSAAGCQALLSATGTPSATAPSGFLLQAGTVEGQKDGLFFFGTNGQQANSWGNSTSFQCVVPPVVRTSLLTATGTAGSCDGAFSLDMNTVWTNQPAKNPGAAAVVQAQLWYRDPFNTANNQATSLSDAIEFTVAP